MCSFLRSRLRVYDIACRYGGDEIVVVVPGADATAARALAEQLRAGIEQLSVVTTTAPVARLTASLGVSAFPDHGATPEAILHAADTALYRAKADGRNRVAGVPTVGPA